MASPTVACDCPREDGIEFVPVLFVAITNVPLTLLLFIQSPCPGRGAPATVPRPRCPKAALSVFNQPETPKEPSVSFSFSLSLSLSLSLCRSVSVALSLSLSPSPSLSFFLSLSLYPSPALCVSLVFSLSLSLSGSLIVFYYGDRQRIRDESIACHE